MDAAERAKVQGAALRATAGQEIFADRRLREKSDSVSGKPA
jgi:hypothetical protein